MKPEKSGNFIMSFQRKAERLDWRKVASLDIDKVFQESDWEQLKELLNQITFCHPETEFNQDKTDPGFIKVFRISQILIEYLVNSQEANTERVEELQSRCQELEAATKTYLEQIENLKLNLMAAKKELRKRKELLANTQSEVLLSEDNKDEFDQCPYCAKKFSTGTYTYLYAHMQRRHQGLPIQSAFPRSFHNFPNVGFPIQQTLPVVCSSPEPGTGAKYVAITVATQTEMLADSKVAAINQGGKSQSQEQSAKDGNENINDSIGGALDKNEHRIDLHMVSELVEKYLEQKSIAKQNQHYDEIFSTIRAVSENRDKDFLERRASFSMEKNSSGDSSRKSSFRAANPTTTVSIEEAERSVSKLREELQIQWHALKGQVHESGIEEMKERLLSEMQKMQELIINSPKMNKEIDVAEQGKADDQAILERSMDERFQKQEEQIEEMKHTLQAKMQADLGILETKLTTQEEYWKSQMASVEQKYQQQLSLLRNELDQAYCKKAEMEAPILLEQEKILKSNEVQREKEIKIGNTKGREEMDKELPLHNTQEITDEDSHPVPVAKPRKTIPIQTNPTSVDIMKVPEVSVANKSTTDNVKPQRRLAPQPPVSMVPKPKDQTKSQVHIHEYDEPKTIQKDYVISDYSDSLSASETSESETQIETDEELVEEKQVKLPKQTAAKYVFDAKKRKLVPIPMGSPSKELDKMAQLRKQAVEEISDQMQKFGINGDENGTLLTKEELRKNLGKLRNSRTAVDLVTFEAQKNSIKKEVDTTAKKLAFEEKIENASLNMGIIPLPDTKVESPGPLTKILRAMKNSRKRKQSTKVIPPPRKSPKKQHRLKTFFFRPNWGKKRNEQTQPEKLSEDEETSDEESSDADLDKPPYIRQAKPVTARSTRKSKTKSKLNNKSSEKSDQESDSDKINEILRNREFPTEKNPNETVDIFPKSPSPKKFQMTGNSHSGRYVTVTHGSGNNTKTNSTQEVAKSNSTTEHGHTKGIFNKKSPAVLNGRKNKRDLLEEFQNAQEVEKAKVTIKQTVTSNMYSPIKKTQGDRNYYDSEDGSGDSQPNYSQQELSEYSEEDDENEKKTGKQNNTQKGQYVTLRHSAEAPKTPEIGNDPPNDKKPIDTSTPIKQSPVDKPRPSTSVVQKRVHSSLFSSASAWDSDSSSEDKASSRRPNTHFIAKKENSKMTIPTVAPKAISRSSPSPFKIIKKASTANPQSSAANAENTQIPKIPINNSWDSDF